MALRGGFELMTELTDLFVQVSRGSGVLGKLNHEIPEVVGNHSHCGGKIGKILGSRW